VSDWKETLPVAFFILQMGIRVKNAL